MADLQMHPVIAVAVMVGTLGSVSSLLACLVYPIFQKVQESRAKLKAVSLTCDGETINAQIPHEELKKLLSTIRKYQSKEDMIGNKLRC